MTCPTCNNDILENDETIVCDCCQQKVHKHCTGTYRDPLDLLFIQYMPSVGSTGHLEWCLPCFELRVYLADMAQLGNAMGKVFKRQADKARQTESLIDNWPTGPKESQNPVDRNLRRL